MRTEKQTVIILDPGDAVVVKVGGQSVTVSNDPDRSDGLILDDVPHIDFALCDAKDGELEEFGLYSFDGEKFEAPSGNPRSIYFQ